MSNIFNQISDTLSKFQQNRDESYNSINSLSDVDAEFAANFAADALLPTDLVYTVNKAARGEEITGEDIALSAVDAVSSALGLVSFGLGKVAGAGLKTAIKGTTTAAKVAATGSKVASVGVGAGGSIIVPFMYEEGTGDVGDGTQDTTPQDTADSGNIPKITVNVTKEVRKQPQQTDSQNLNSAMLAYLLAKELNEQNAATTYENTPTTNEQTPNYVPLLAIGAFALIVVILAIRR